MKSLLPPSVAVLFSTAGTAYGCHLVGMPLHDVKLATALAFAASFTAVFGVAFLAGRPARPRRNPTP